jgi:hypothetical protein
MLNHNNGGLSDLETDGRGDRRAVIAHLLERLLNHYRPLLLHDLNMRTIAIAVGSQQQRLARAAVATFGALMMIVDRNRTVGVAMVLAAATVCRAEIDVDRSIAPQAKIHRGPAPRKELHCQQRRYEKQTGHCNFGTGPTAGAYDIFYLIGRSRGRQPKNLGKTLKVRAKHPRKPSRKTIGY